MGRVRAEAFYSGDENVEHSLGILIHGDAAFTGQGVVMETFNLDDLRDYTTHGAIHLVVNNQVHNIIRKILSISYVFMPTRPWILHFYKVY